MKKSYILLICLILLILSVSAVSAGLFDSKDDKLKVENIKISDEGYDSYEVTCDLESSDEFDYLEMVILFYDDSGALLEKSLVWNMLDVPKDQHIKVSGFAYVSSGTPAKAEVLFIDDSLKEDAEHSIYNETIEM